MKGQVYTLDAIAAATLILTILISLLMVNQLHTTVRYEAPDNILGVLLNRDEFIHAIYNLDSSKLRTILNAHLGMTPYNFTIYNANGTKLLSIGVEIQGIAATVMLAGVNGTIKPLIICLKVKQP